MDAEAVVLLRENLGKARNTFDEWARDRTKWIESVQTEHHAQKAQLAAQIRDAQVREKELEQQGQAASQRSHRNKQETDLVRADIEQLRQKELALPPASAHVSSQILQEHTRLQKCCEIVQHNDSVFHDASINLDRFLNMYRTALGLELSRAEAQVGLTLSFTCIDRKNPARRFVATLLLEQKDGDEDMYRVSECVPMVDGLAALVQDLNDTKGLNLARFVVRLRKAFAALGAETNN